MLLYPNYDTALKTLTGLTNPSEATLALERAKVSSLDAQIEALEGGPNTMDVKLAELELENAKAQLTLIQEEQEPEEITAPFAGMILAVNATVGDSVGSSPIINLVNTSHTTLEIYVDEADLNQVGVGYEVEVLFDALPEQTFTGKVVSIDPSLYNTGQYQALRGEVELDPASFAKPQNLPYGINASVEVIGSRAENVLLVPVEALREIATDKYAVFVQENGELKLKVVEIGLMDYTYAEIKSGLNERDVVTTGVVETGQ